jgi:hypothetical protein
VLRTEQFATSAGVAAPLYLWTDESGLLQHATEAPTDMEFRRLRAGGFALFVERGLNLGEWVRVERSLLPPWGLSIGFGLMGHVGGEGGAAF